MLPASCAQPFTSKHWGNVRFGSLADIRMVFGDVCFAPESRPVQRRNQCPLGARSRHTLLAFKLSQSNPIRSEVMRPLGALTGLRRGDAVRFGRQHVRDGVGTIKTEKSGFTVEVTLPILSVLQ